MIKQQPAKHTCCGTSNRWKFYWWSYHSSNYPISWIKKLIEDVVDALGDPVGKEQAGQASKVLPQEARLHLLPHQLHGLVPEAGGSLA